MCRGLIGQEEGSSDLFSLLVAQRRSLIDVFVYFLPFYLTILQVVEVVAYNHCQISDTIVSNIEFDTNNFLTERGSFVAASSTISNSINEY